MPISCFISGRSAIRLPPWRRSASSDSRAGFSRIPARRLRSNFRPAHLPLGAISSVRMRPTGAEVKSCTSSLRRTAFGIASWPISPGAMFLGYPQRLLSQAPSANDLMPTPLRNGPEMRRGAIRAIESNASNYFSAATPMVTVAYKSRREKERVGAPFRMTTERANGNPLRARPGATGDG